jgi:hypothetical protein
MNLPPGNLQRRQMTVRVSDIQSRDPEPNLTADRL